MPDANKKSPIANKKSPAVPQTDTSLGDDKSTRNFVYAMIAVTVLMLIVGGVALYWLIGRYVYQTNQNKAQDETIKLLEEKKKDIASLKPNYDAIKAPGPGGRSQADLILNAMPTDEGFRQFVGMIENMAQKANVKVSNLSKPGAGAGAAPGPNSTTPLPAGVQSSLVSVPIEGSYDNIINFLEETENSSRVMDFVSMNIGDITGNITVSPTFRIYWKSPANIGPTQKELQ
jgi:hypothetical protein